MTIGYAERKLEGDWAVFVRIAGYFVYKVPLNDREDFRQDLMVEMGKVKAKYAVRGKLLTEASLMLVAKYELKDYWDKRRYRLFGLNCYRCTIEQRRECQATKLSSECPKKRARRIVSLNKIMGDGDGDGLTELGDLIADDKPIDLAAKLDARRILQSLPKKVVQIGYKIYAGMTLGEEEKEYIKRWRWQRTLPSTFDWRQSREYLDERILELLCKKPQGVSRRDLCTRLQVPIMQLKRNLNRLIERHQVIVVRRENTRGRPPSPLLFIAGAEIPKEKMVKEERDDRIRQAYFIEGWSIKRINRELHHHRKLIRRAIHGIKIERR